MPHRSALCIRCNLPVPLVASHIVSNFIRKRIFGADGRFAFEWGGGPALADGAVTRTSSKAAQNLPTEPLMCGSCDSHYGIIIEKSVGLMLASLPLETDPLSIYRSKWLAETTFPGLEGFREYEQASEEDVLALSRFVVLTCWRALHQIARSHSDDVARYLASPRGRIADANAILFMEHNRVISMQQVQLFLVPLSVAHTVLSDGRGPFGWAYLDNGAKGVVVWIAHWAMVWVFDVGTPMETAPVRVEELVRHAVLEWPKSLGSRIAGLSARSRRTEDKGGVAN